MSNSNLNEKIFRVTPNPFKTHIKIINSDYEKEFSYTIIDINSRIITSGTSITNSIINTDILINGIYFLNVKFDKRHETHRIIKSV